MGVTRDSRCLSLSVEDFFKLFSCSMAGGFIIAAIVGWVGYSVRALFELFSYKDV